jgi:hypothetical protein
LGFAGSKNSARSPWYLAPGRLLAIHSCGFS